MPDVVLPCLNEAEALPWVLQRMPAGYRPIVADNESTDGSAEIARDHGARVVQASPKGFGAACHAGLLAADHEDDVICFMDADGSFDPAELPRVAEPICDDELDLVLGSRSVVTRGAWPAHARLGNRVLARELAKRTPYRLTDLGPMRAMRRSGLVALDLQDRRFGYPLEMVLAAAHENWRVREVEVSYLARTGRSKVTGTVRGTARAVKDMTRVLREVDQRRAERARFTT